MRKVTWGTAFANTAWAPFFENAVSYGEPGPDWEWVRAPSGFQDAWIGQEDQRAAGDVRWVPPLDTVDPFATGWDGSAGWRAFLYWARQKNPFRFYNDARNLYANPLLSTDANADGVCDGHTKAASVASSVFSIEDTAQKIVLAATAPGHSATLTCSPIVLIPGVTQPLAYSIEAKSTKAGAITGALRLRVRRRWRDAGGTILTQATFNMTGDLQTTAGYVRYTISETSWPTGAAGLDLVWELYANDASENGSTVWLRRAQVEFGGFSTFVNSDAYVLSYLMGPMGGEPQLENNGTRRFRLEMASATGATYDGF